MITEREQPKEGSVTAAANRLSESIGVLYDIAHTLEKRLSPVCNPPLPREDKKHVPTAVSAPLAIQLSNCNDRMLEIYRKVQSVLDTLEI